MKCGRLLSGKNMLIGISLLIFANCRSEDIKKTYYFENSQISQTVIVTYVKNGIDFYCEFLDKNNKTNNIVFKGVAEKNTGIEIDEDEEGISYPSEEYIFSNNKITVKFRIAQKNKNKMKVITTNDLFSYKGLLLLK
ncbi:MAG TPA: hypothetical protein PKU84_14565 [Spirochaetota bacterium]|nr:hypothetical protein [Spirochaetota bacterium]HPK57717.1 hypothetical protein [Spirochaetota bacterium]